MINELKKLIEQSERIVITAHLGPDADSLCSSLLLQVILEENYQSKQITVCMEEDYKPLSFLNGYSSIEIGSLASSLDKHKTELLIILDGNNVPRCSREPEKVRQYIEANGLNVAVIDHHEPIDTEPGALYINQKSPAVTQDIYEICFDHLGLAKPDGYAQTAMIGLYSDTGGFTYENPRYKDTFKMAAELINDGASTELAASQLTQYSEQGLEVLQELIRNVTHVKDCTYTFVSDDFYKEWLASNKPVEAIHEGFDIFRFHFIRSIDGRFWGFVVYPDPNSPTGTYRISFRAQQGKVDVSGFAKELGGGGHKAAAGAKIKASSVEEAINQVKKAIGAV